MLAEFYSPRLLNDMKITTVYLQKNHFRNQILYEIPDRVKNWPGDKKNLGRDRNIARPFIGGGVYKISIEILGILCEIFTILL